MAIVINGSGTVTGLAVGGLPDGTVDAGTVAADVATQAEIDAKLNLSGGTMTGNLNIIQATSGTGSSAVKELIYNEGAGDAALHLALSGSTDWYVGADNTDNSLKIGQASWDSSPYLAIDTTGAVTMPSQPAFLAWSNANATIANNTWTDIQFATERFDTGSDFNSATGIFTAPVTGKYQINYNVRIDGIAASVAHASVQIYTSNQDYAYQTIITPTAYDSILNYHSFNGSLLVDMDANDTAKLRALINGSTGNYGGWLGTTFSAHLVC